MTKRRSASSGGHTVILALRRPKQEDHYKFKANMDYILSPKIICLCYRVKLCLKQSKTKQKDCIVGKPWMLVEVLTGSVILKNKLASRCSKG